MQDYFIPVCEFIPKPSLPAIAFVQEYFIPVYEFIPQTSLPAVAFVQDLSYLVFK